MKYALWVDLGEGWFVQDTYNSKEEALEVVNKYPFEVPCYFDTIDED